LYIFWRNFILSCVSHLFNRDRLGYPDYRFWWWFSRAQTCQTIWDF